MNREAEQTKLSTTALARKLDIPVQQLFVTLRDYGWITRAGDSWALTPKGEFEGGSYHNSRRYGAYIVWPERLDQHPLIAAIEANQRVHAGSLRRYYPRLHARHINRALAELGLQQHTLMGWELTPLGKSLGGQQEESESSGAFYVSWPHTIVDNPIIHRELTRQSENYSLPSGDEAPAQDMFAASTAGAEACAGIDGHQLHTVLQARVCNWLYLAQLAHAFQRALPTEETVCADFYVPAGNVYIDCWEAEIPAGELSGKLHRREMYRALQLRHLEVNAADAERLDEVLGRGLLEFGVRS